MRVNRSFIDLRLTPEEVMKALREKYDIQGEFQDMFDGDYEEPIQELSIILSKDKINDNSKEETKGNFRKL